ncbi:MAG: hypothetical protein LBL77_02815 [Endomicrobium sp.]|jgi:hypothetical protein|nr:hypothetical protein [Endomicrobium sp.]
MTNILILSIQNRKTGAVKIQEILTSSDCIIKTRLGFHDDSTENVSLDIGIVILVVFGRKESIKKLIVKLNSVDGVKSKFVEI